MAWYSIRTLYAWDVIPRGKKIARRLPKQAQYFEERVVLMKASSFSGATKKAEREARSYEDSFRNSRGELVSVRFLGVSDSFALFDPPGAGREVYSNVEAMNRRMGINKYIELKFGKKRSAAQQAALRKRILNAKL